jgi:hypothetical protein
MRHFGGDQKFQQKDTEEAAIKWLKIKAKQTHRNSNLDYTVQEIKEAVIPFLAFTTPEEIINSLVEESKKLDYETRKNIH